MFALKIAAALALMAGALWWMAGPPSQWLVWQGLERALRLCVVCAVGGGVYFAALAVFGFRLKDFSRRVTD